MLSHCLCSSVNFFPLLSCSPSHALKLALTRLGEWHEFVVLVDGEAHQRHEVGEDAFGAGAFDLGFFQRGVGLPELGFVPEVGRLFDGVGEFFDGLEGEALFVGFAVEHLQGGDFVFVVLDELLEGLHDALGAVEGFGAEAGVDDLVLADVVDGQFGLLFDLDQELAELRIVQWLDGVLNQRVGYLLNLLLARFACAELLHCSLFAVGRDRGLRRGWARSLSARPPLASLMSCSSSFADAVFHSGQAAGEEVSTSSSVLPKATAWSSFSKVTVGFFSIGRESVLSCSQTPTASTMTKWSLAVASGVTPCRSSGLMTRTPRPFICSKKARDLTARMKMTISTGLMSVPVAIMSTVTAMRGMVAVAEALDEVLGLRAGGAVGDLLGEVVALAELLAHDFDDVFGVGVVLGEDEGLGHLGAAGKDFGEQLVAEGATMVRIWSGATTSRSSWLGS